MKTKKNKVVKAIKDWLWEFFFFSGMKARRDIEVYKAGTKLIRNAKSEQEVNEIMQKVKKLTN